MSKTYFTRKRGAPHRSSEGERSRLDKLTDAEIEARALSDPDNPPQTKEQLRRMVLAREVRRKERHQGLQPTTLQRASTTTHQFTSARPVGTQWATHIDRAGAPSPLRYPRAAVRIGVQHARSACCQDV